MWTAILSYKLRWQIYDSPSVEISDRRIIWPFYLISWGSTLWGKLRPVWKEDGILSSYTAQTTSLMYADTKYHQISLLFLECTEMYLLILHFKTTSKSKSTEILKSDNFVFKATDLYYKALGKLGKFSQPQFLSSKR